ncbi:MAG: UbiX family flavin prenyltransferase [Candidatus Altiarchaeota archaeon]
MKIVVAITGASGVIVAKKLLENLKEHETHLIITENAKKVISYELPNEKLEKLASFFYDENDLNSRLSSSSFIADAMVIVPCSMKTLAAIANGFSENLVSRCAENFLKCNRKLIVVPRDTPLSLSAIENMRKLKLAGAIILPMNVAYYHKPKSVDDITNFFVGKILDMLNLENKLYRRWKENDI